MTLTSLVRGKTATAFISFIPPSHPSQMRLLPGLVQGVTGTDQGKVCKGLWESSQRFT